MKDKDLTPLERKLYKEGKLKLPKELEPYRYGRWNDFDSLTKVMMEALSDS